MAQSAPLLIPLPAILAVLGVLLALVGGMITYAAQAGRANRVLSREQTIRVITGALISSVLAFAVLLLSSWLWLQSEGGIQGRAFGVTTCMQFNMVSGALGLPLVFVAAGALFASAQNGRNGRNISVIRTGQLLASLFVWWLPRIRPVAADVAGQDDEPDFEVTLASGEEVEAEEREYIENILELGDTTAQEVMTPRTDVIALDAAWESERIVGVVADARFSRFPVFEESIDNIVGVLHLRDLLEYLARGEGASGMDLKSMLIEASFVPAGRKVDDVLRDLQHRKTHMAVVLDEYGGTAGILTIEDLLEEIVGEIQDEYDDESKLVHQREDGSYIITAQLPLDDINELFSTSLGAEDVDTLGGFIANSLGHIPEGRESIVHGELRFTVLSVDKNRIGRVLVEKL